MESLRNAWLAAWGGAAVGAIVVGADVLGPYFPLYVAGFCLFVGLTGYWRMRWRRVAATSPSESPDRAGGAGPYRFKVEYEPRVASGGLICKLRCPPKTKVTSVVLYRGDGGSRQAIRAWVPRRRSALRTVWRGARLEVFEPELREADMLSFTVESPTDFDETRVKLYRGE